MSNQPPARRRRIAGERRRPATEPTSLVGDGVPGDEAPAPHPAPLTKPTPQPAAEAPATATPEPASPPAQAPVPAPAPPAGTRPRARFRGVPRPGPVDAVLGALTLLAAAAIVVLLLGLPQGPVRALGLPEPPDLGDVAEAEQAQVAAETAPSVAERAAEAILAYDHRTLDTDQDAAQRFMTSSFAEKYAGTFDTTVEPAARTYRAQVSAQVKGVSVVRATADQARVLLFVDQTTRSTAHDRPQVALNRVEFEMVQEDGEWLVDHISSY